MNFVAIKMLVGDRAKYLASLYVDDLAGKGLDFKVLSELLYYFALTFVPTALPLGILLART